MPSFLPFGLHRLNVYWSLACDRWPRDLDFKGPARPQRKHEVLEENLLRHGLGRQWRYLGVDVGGRRAGGLRRAEAFGLAECSMDAVDGDSNQPFTR